ncbi:hypothetical protein LZ198_01140 [Myxococcus sp. K15C18031901]|uniref:hypothetical protein n=1 Tax=Myxococcus dinghuensis TaxID=2906761 RepID=UPI0020A6F35E|nr:hypothetical protein [Myxococcus dinghuensis]MCP3097472.1 hypothetical protein [Myxococcus dinghuensis]
METRLLKCPGCGANLPPPSSISSILTCDYCGAMVSAKGVTVWPRPARPADDPPFAPDRPRVTVEDTRYVLLGRLGRGDSSDVFLARRDARLTEMVVIKVARALADADLSSDEYTTLETLQGSTAQGAEHFTRLLPQPVARGLAKEAGGTPRPATVYRWASGFQHAFTELREVYAEGIDPRAAVWMWKRALELLGFVHRSGYVHGAVLPPHLLVHPRDHGLMLVGWTHALPRGGRGSARALSTAHRAFYPEALWRGGAPSTATDAAMCARSLVWVLGGDPSTGTTPTRVPPPLADLLRAQCEPANDDVDAWALKEQVSAAAHEAFGPSRFTPFTLPGWR